MADQNRARSPSAAHLNNTAPTPQQQQQQPAYHPSFAASADPSTLPSSSSNLYSDPYSQAHTGALDPTNTQNYLFDPTFANTQAAKLQQATNDLALLQSQNFAAQGNSDFNYNQGGVSSDSSAFPSFDFNQTDFSEDALDPAFLAELDAQQQQISQMAAALQPHSPTPPHLLPEMARRQSNSHSPSPHASPAFHQQSTVNRPRGTSESLDPSSALFPQGQNEWSNMGAYRGHMRTPSDQYSEYSNHSNQASPYLQTYDSFDANAHSSPLINPQQDPSFTDSLGLQQFNLNGDHPGHSPHISPNLMPQQQALPQFTAGDFGLNQDQFVQQNNGLDMYTGAGQEAFPQLNKPQSPNDLGAADQMSPPEIQVEYAPPAMNPNQVLRSTNDGEALSPPARTQSRNRMRAKSDSYAGSRPSSPAVLSRGRSPSLQPGTAISDNLTPFDQPSSRSPSPRGRDKSASRGRSTSHASDQRDYILNLAEPERTPSNGVKDNGRVQKHPATFQCHLCPKRFTRAYNLRSHLRTHTDERPFVCTVCGKAFARQHDRKRHEGLHSGEKKFVCKGVLQSGAQWGCGRRFARADALGRHFRSEAGRVCIKPLLDEEAEERQKAWMEEQQQAQVAAGLVAPQPLMSHAAQMEMNATFLPAVLLQQYPALATIDWNTLPQGPPPEEEAYNSRSSFEASSGGEYYDDMSGDDGAGGFSDEQMGGMGGFGDGQQGGLAGHQQQQQQQQQQGFYGGQSTGDYLGDFEGR
ncbi:hypothetical protein BDY17DRAFT_327192 [Neohortaea acidophila]|uniref:C2H2-type domain-containing protein n=1 Tax=Neohortaea acidophila TaxID=245834 RepID=A0A6A6PJH4_9PEZI|nr:uncharacterized protein BDY17DRAFT_327192 [Neohortaea acidophila]KAF2480218.1 hypothetical protein BDY17DRAFT_327192 [Neohortaea acidophila]